VSSLVGVLQRHALRLRSTLAVQNGHAFQHTSQQQRRKAPSMTANHTAHNLSCPLCPFTPWQAAAGGS
jgi:hypothetical protein